MRHSQANRLTGVQLADCLPPLQPIYQIISRNAGVCECAVYVLLIGDRNRALLQLQATAVRVSTESPAKYKCGVEENIDVFASLPLTLRLRQSRVSADTVNDEDCCC